MRIPRRRGQVSAPAAAHPDGRAGTMGRKRAAIARSAAPCSVRRPASAPAAPPLTGSGVLWRREGGVREGKGREGGRREEERGRGREKERGKGSGWEKGRGKAEGVGGEGKGKGEGLGEVMENG